MSAQENQSTKDGVAETLRTNVWLGVLVPSTAMVLHTPATAVDDIASQVVPYIARMKELMAQHNGVGLAAPQVGIPLRFFVSKIPDHGVVINPRIVSTGGGRVSKSEGCLSWPGRTTYMSRARCVVTEWTDRNGNKRTSTLQDFNARIFLHEADHLNGLCIFPQQSFKSKVNRHSTSVMTYFP